MSGQAQFRAALLDAAMDAPLELQNPEGGPAGSRFSVYRNNVAVALTDALATGFPAVERLLGAQNFKAVAGTYVRKHPPKSPLMMHYGQDFPEFLKDFEQLNDMGYLADVARLELAIRASYHAADASAIDPDALAELTESSRVTLAPSARLIASVWPIWDIWQFATQDGAKKPRAEPQHVAILRPHFDPLPHPLTPGEGAWLAALQRGDTLGAAIDAAPQGFDMTGVLTLLIQNNAIAQISTIEPKD